MRILYSVILGAVIVICGSCQQKKTESLTTGNLHILMSESIAPAVIEEINTFAGIYAEDGAHITYALATSDEAIKRFVSDTIRCIFTTRPLTTEERKPFEADPKGLTEIVVAFDALGVITQEKNTITQMTTKDLHDILTGSVTRWEQLSHPAKMKGPISIFLQDSSDVMTYLQKRILQGDGLSRKLNGTNSSLQTIESGAKEPLSIGFVGIDWIDSAKANVKILELAEMNQKADTTFKIPDEAVGKFYSPHPANIYRNYYPLKRAIYLYAKTSLGSFSSGFAAFVANNNGQQIFLKRKLVPGTQKIRLKAND